MSWYTCFYNMETVNSTEQSIDDVISNLMSMGFTHEDCCEAISFGKLSLGEAVEWILSGKPKTSSSGHLVLHSTVPHSGSQNPVVTKPPAASEESTKPSHSVPAATAEHKVHSRYVDSREEREKFRDKKRQKIEKQVKLDKINRMKERENVLKEIESDRRAQLQKQSGNTSLDTKTSASSVTPVQSSSGSCLVQIRLLNGTAIRNKFSSEDKVSDILEFLKDKVTTDSHHQLKLLQPFPRVELNTGPSTLAQLGLCPSCSLVIQVVSTESAVTTQTSASQGNASVATENHSVPPLSGVAQYPSIPISEARAALSSEPHGQQYSYSPPSLPQSLTTHHWPRAGGHRLGYDDDVEESESSHSNNARSSVEENSSPLMGIEPTRHSASSHDWGTGLVLGDESEVSPEVESGENPEDENDDANRAELQLRRDRIMQALLQRSHDDEETESHLHHDPTWQKVDSLTAMCIQLVIRRIGSKGKENLSSLGHLPLSLANKVLDELISNKKLNPNTLLLFRSSPFFKLKLDYYCYATNQLLMTCKIFRDLRVLSLRSCSLLTDNGMEILSLLPQLQYVDLADCKQLTDKTLAYLQDSDQLSHLSLDGTHVTNVGMSQYLQHPRPKLIYLSLRDLPGVTESCLNTNLSNLETLNIDKTGVRRLNGIADSARNLKHLSFSGCIIFHEQFLCLQSLRHSLTSLNVVGVRSLLAASADSYADIGDFVAKNIQDLNNLQRFEFEFRHSLTSEGLQYFSHLPLTSLNLAHHRSVDDVGLQHISLISSLRKLDLANTNITDDGLPFLSSLLSRLTELDLSRTSISSRGIIRMFSTLQEEQSNLVFLSFQQTRVDDELLRSLSLNRYTPGLVTLNMRNTRVTDTGLRYLVLSYLRSLLLNGASVSAMTQPGMFTGCPSLRHVNIDKSVTS